MGDSNLISERKFLATHTSFWRVLMPMGDQFVRNMNQRLHRYSAGVASRSSADRKALISEASFRMFCLSMEGAISLDDSVLSSSRVLDASNAALRYIGALDHGKVSRPLTKDELSESLQLARDLVLCFEKNEDGERVVLRPKFRGCGIVNDCEGDLIVGSVLYEVKNVDRDFRLVDIRQLLTYAALNFSGSRYPIDAVALVNARRGILFKIKLNSLSLAAAQIPANTLLGEIVEFMSSELPSR